tara:strand:+ start:459 stop:743 length:285 start_codon:yes stop_codon:yes gene_type:complete
MRSDDCGRHSTTRTLMRSSSSIYREHGAKRMNDAVGIIATKVCVVCEEEFAINRWQRQKKYCSDRCSAQNLRVHGHLKTKYTELEPTKKLKSKK